MSALFRIVPGTLAILATFLLLGLVFAGVGLAVRRAAGRTALTLDDAFLAFWIGFAAVLLFLLGWNFAFPIGIGAQLVVGAAGLSGLVLCRREISRLGAGFDPKADWRAALAIGLLLLWLSARAVGKMTNWDSALYHMQGVRWAIGYPAVPGIANLFGPLAFNNASLLYDALLDLGPWRGQSWHLANGLLLAVLLGQLVVAGTRLLRGGPDLAVNAFAFAFLGLVASLGMSEELTSYVTDLSSNAVRLIATVLVYRALTARQSPEDSGIFELGVVVALAASAVAIKTSALVSSATLVVTMFLAVAWRGHRPGRLARSLAVVAVIGLAFGSAWAARGIILSGYPAFPSPVLAAPVEWRAPVEHAVAEFVYVQHTTRSSTGNLPFIAGTVTGLSAWVPNWLSKLPSSPYSVMMPLLLFAVLLPAARLVSLSHPEPADQGHGWWLLAAAGVGLIGWFAIAPAPRYAAVVLWTLPAIASGEIVRRATGNSAGIRRALFALTAGVAAAALVALPLVDWNDSGRRGSPLKAILTAHLDAPEPGAWVNGPAGGAIVTPYRTQSGLEVAVPEHRCWDADPPCTPNPAPNLRLRVPGRIERGFVVDGPWQMRDWPEPWKQNYRSAYDEWVARHPTRSP